MKIRRFITFFAAALALFVKSAVAGPTHEVVTSFDAPLRNPSRGKLALGPDGYYWGATESGGLYDDGTIYKINAITGALTTVLEFGGSNIGARPNSGLVSDGLGFMWGTTYWSSSIFKINVSTNVLTTVAYLGGTNKGLNPASGLVADGTGFFWGTTEQGGANNYGTVFKVNASTGAFTTIVEFTSYGTSNKGARPFATLIGDGAGFLWGTSVAGGINDKGTVFKINISTGLLTTIIEFTGNGTSNKGSSPYGALVWTAISLVT
jgi:uncharacterized repeat protein (TIGR03803 family)